MESLCYMLELFFQMFMISFKLLDVLFQIRVAGKLIITVIALNTMQVSTYFS